MPGMKATRKSQPYKEGAATRVKTRALSAAMKGATASGSNPRNEQRAAAAKSRAQSGAAVATARARAGGLRGKLSSATAGIKVGDSPLVGAKRAPAKPKLPGEKKGAGTRVRAPRAAKRVLRDGLKPRLYASGTRTNTSSDSPRKGEEFRTFTKGGKEFHEYVDEATGKKVVVAGGRKSKKRKAPSVPSSGPASY
jgi:hypothetical protein